jgi:hypothetical protein
MYGRSKELKYVKFHSNLPKIDQKAGVKPFLGVCILVSFVQLQTENKKIEEPSQQSHFAKRQKTLGSTRGELNARARARRLRRAHLAHNVLASRAPAAPLTPPPGPSRRLRPQMARKRTCDCFAAAALSQSEQYTKTHTQAFA